MSNRIRISVTYSFRGETHQPFAEIDLDVLAESGEPPDWHALLARAAGIDTYSYAYEVIETTRIVFSAPTGIATRHLQNDEFDFAGFLQSLEQQRLIDALRDIAKAALPAECLQDEATLMGVLLQAYRLGKQA